MDGATAIVQVFVSGTDEMEFANDFLPILLAVVSSHRILWVTATRWPFRENKGNSGGLSTEGNRATKY